MVNIILGINHYAAIMFLKGDCAPTEPLTARLGRLPTAYSDL